MIFRPKYDIIAKNALKTAERLYEMDSYYTSAVEISSLSLAAMLSGYVNEEFAFEGENMKRAIERTFYNEEKGAFFASTEDKNCYTELGNSFAVLIGLDKGKIIDKLTDKSMIPVTLSMSCFLYDALLQSDRRYNEYVLNDIKKKYTFMLEKGATSF